MNWRPEGWGNQTLSVDCKMPIASIAEVQRMATAFFEAGADAMLEALKKQGQYGKGTDFRNPAIDKESLNKYGWLIFILDT